MPTRITTTTTTVLLLLLLLLVQDGSFYVWQAGSGALVRRFLLPPQCGLPPGLHTTFALSPDNQSLVAGGPHLPLLLHFHPVRPGANVW
jgi:hypothetical protein